MMIQIFYASTRSTSTSEKNSSEFSQWSPAFFDLVFEFWLLFQRLFEKERERENQMDIRLIFSLHLFIATSFMDLHIIQIAL